MNPILARVLCTCIGYVFGLIQTAYFYGKAHGIDIRQHGSGNAGTTNTLRVLGTKAGIFVFFGDLFKALIAVKIVEFTFGTFLFPEMKYLLMLYAAVGVILAHDFPPYLHFKGGKGIAATAGVMLGYHWVMIIVGLVTFFSCFFATHYVSLGSMMLYIGFFAFLIIIGQNGMLGMSQEHLIEAYIVAGCLLLLAVFLHRENIKRLIHGNERKTYLSKKNKVEANVETKTADSDTK